MCASLRGFVSIMLIWKPRWVCFYIISTYVTFLIIISFLIMAFTHKCEIFSKWKRNKKRTKKGKRQNKYTFSFIFIFLYCSMFSLSMCSLSTIICVMLYSVHFSALFSLYVQMWRDDFYFDLVWATLYSLNPNRLLVVQ